MLGIAVYVNYDTIIELKCHRTKKKKGKSYLYKVYDTGDLIVHDPKEGADILAIKLLAYYHQYKDKVTKAQEKAMMSRMMERIRNGKNKTKQN